jgi:hypothetical protein
VSDQKVTGTPASRVSQIVCFSAPLNRLTASGNLESGIIGLVKRAVSLFVTTVAAIVTLGCGDSLPAAGATTSHTSPFCTTALKPMVRQWQRIPHVTAVSSATLAKTRNELLAAARAILKTTTSLEVQLRSAPASARRAFNRDVSAEKRFTSAVEHATTPAQMKLAVRSRVFSLAREGPFVIYALSRCEGRPIPAP